MSVASGISRPPCIVYNGMRHEYNTCLQGMRKEYMAISHESDTRSTGAHTSERDILAEHRTTLANERTLLAYIRTALAFFIVGVTLVKFFGHPLITAIGWVFIPVGVIILGKGIASFRSMKRQIEMAREDD